MKRLIIIGNGPSALSAIETIRKKDDTLEIILFSEEPYPPYSRPLISYLLAGKIEEERMFYKGRDFHEHNNIQAKLGEKVVEVDTKNARVYSSSGEVLSYDNLLIATGGKPIIPQLPGKELEGVFTFTTLDDAKGIERYMREEKVENVVIIGGGLIGLKVMEALTEWVVNVTIVELADRILSSTLDRRASAIIQSELEAKGVRIITQNTVQEVRGKKKIKEVMLKDGRVIPAEMLVFAIGVAPAVKVFLNSGLNINRGILVNQKMETNIPGIYAAGDVVETENLTTGRKQPIAIWPNATQGGSVAGANILGEERTFSGSFPMNSVEILGIPTISMGFTEPQEEGYEVFLDCEGLRYKKIVLKDGRIVGAVFVGNVERAGIFCSLIKEQVDVSPFKERLLEEDFGLVYLPKDYRQRKISEGVRL